MSILLHKPYVEKWSTKGEGSKMSKNCPHGLWMTPYKKIRQLLHNNALCEGGCDTVKVLIEYLGNQSRGMDLYSLTRGHQCLAVKLTTLEDQ